MGGNKRLTREGSFPLGILEKGAQVANLIDSSLMGKRIERPLLSRGSTGSSLAKDVGTLVLNFPYLKPTAATWSRRGVLELVFPHLKPIATTWSVRGRGEHVCLLQRRIGAAFSLVRGAWLGDAAREAQATLPWLRGAALETRTPVADFMPRLRGTALGARVNSSNLDHGQEERRTERVFPSSKLPG